MPDQVFSMTHVAPTITRILGVRDLAHATGQPIPPIVEEMRGLERLAVLAPDALGVRSLEHFAGAMPFLWSLYQRRHVNLRSVLPSITPVNFATMVTGCALDGHGVRAKEMKVECETVFDVLVEAGKSGAGCGRPGYTGSDLLGRIAQIDGTAALPDDAAVEEAVMRIARDLTPEFIIAQIGGTDDHFHRFGPYSERVVPKLCETDGRLQRMVEQLQSLGYGVIILSDHGQHETGAPPDRGGSHGTDSEEDCLVPCTWISPT